MTSSLHDALLSHLRNRPRLSVVLVQEALGISLPHCTEVRMESAEFRFPSKHDKDLVVLLDRGKPVLGIVVEVQLTVDEEKWFSWPMYAVTVRARLDCPTAMLVVAPDEQVAQWAASPIDLGDGNRFTPWVLGPSVVRQILGPAAVLQ